MHPVVTIAVSSREDETSIEACLAAARSQDYPGELEILVADAMSMDATREKVLAVAKIDPRVRLVDNPGRTRGAALNAALRASKGDIVVPMDPGGEYARTHVSKCVEALETSDQVTIEPRTAGRTIASRALSAAQRTSMAFAPRAELLGAVRRRILEKVGLFDPGAKAEEDWELTRRIGPAPARRDIVVHRTEASSFVDLWKRHFVLGRSRARRVVKDRRVESLRTLAPFAIVLAGGALAATSSIQPITPLAAAAYALYTGAAAVRVGQLEGLVTIPIAWAAYPVMHVAHGAGFGAGLVRALVKPDWGSVARLDDPMPVSVR